MSEGMSMQSLWGIHSSLLQQFSTVLYFDVLAAISQGSRNIGATWPLEIYEIIVTFKNKPVQSVIPLKRQAIYMKCR